MKGIFATFFALSAFIGYCSSPNASAVPDLSLASKFGPFALALADSSQQAAQLQEYKGVFYQKPTGWEQTAEEENLTLMPKGLKEGEALLIVLLPAFPSTKEPLKAQFKVLVDASNENGKILESGEVIQRDSDSVSLLIQTFKLESPDVGKHVRLYGLVHIGEQNAFALMIATSEALVDKYSEEVLSFFSSITFKTAAPKPKPDPIPAKPASSQIPTGDTPDEYPGVIGFRPSGRGMQIPTASITKNGPVGFWWKAVANQDGRTEQSIHIFMPNGICASQPRLGGGNLYDYEGQQKQKGITGVGTYSIENGRLIEKHGSFRSNAAYSTGKDAQGIFFRQDGAVCRPIILATKANVVGTWRADGNQYVFRADGTYEKGSVFTNGEWTAGGRGTGTYIIEGYLMMLTPASFQPDIDIVGFAGPMFFKGSTFYYKV